MTSRFQKGVEDAIDAIISLTHEINPQATVTPATTDTDTAPASNNKTSRWKALAASYREKLESFVPTPSPFHDPPEATQATQPEATTLAANAAQATPPTAAIPDYIGGQHVSVNTRA